MIDWLKGSDWWSQTYWRFHLDAKQWNKGEKKTTTTKKKTWWTKQESKTKVKQKYNNKNDMETKNSITLQTEASKNYKVFYFLNL